jgi:hypothetical protein
MLDAQLYESKDYETFLSTVLCPGLPEGTREHSSYEPTEYECSDEDCEDDSCSTHSWSNSVKISQKQPLSYEIWNSAWKSNPGSIWITFSVDCSWNFHVGLLDAAYPLPETVPVLSADNLFEIVINGGGYGSPVSGLRYQSQGPLFDLKRWTIV